MEDGDTTNGSIYLCIKQFNARLGDEINMKPGDKIEVLADDSEYNDGWFMGKNLETNEVGLYPNSFTQILHDKPENGLLRARSRRVGNISTKNMTPSTSQTNLADITDSVEHLNISNKSASKDVNSTMNDIDQALKELNGNSSYEEDTGNFKNGHQRVISTLSFTDDLNPLDVLNWTPKQVSSYFALVLGFDMSVAGNFARHKITGAILIELDLAHLKELDMDSFGTRFEVHKEIERLRQMAKRVQQKKFGNEHKNSTGNVNGEDEFVSPPASKNPSPYKYNTNPNNSDEDAITSPSQNPSQNYSSLLTPSQNYSSLLTPSQNSYNSNSYDNSNSINNRSKKHERKRSQSLDDIPNGDKRKSFLDSPEFASPRKAPEPPTASPLNTSFKFGESSSPSPAADKNFYRTRTNASSTGLGIVQPSGIARPASSVYDMSVSSIKKSLGPNNHSREPSHSRNLSVTSGGHHRRHSSLFLFSHHNDDHEDALSMNKQSRFSPEKRLSSPTKLIGRLPLSPMKKDDDLTKISTNEEDIDNVGFSPKKLKSLSYKLANAKNEKDDKRSVSDSTVKRFKNLRTTSTQNFKNLTSSKKLKTSAFQEGIREITPDEAIKTANFSGWMGKKSGSTLGWRSRYFTLHGTRLSYFTSLRDKREKGLIDITAHKVIPVNSSNDNSNDKYLAFYASSTGFGRYCFKLVPPSPGFKKGLTFTQPKTHYFAVETQEDMRSWLKALMTATIDIDDSVPVVSSCSTPTVTLKQAQELLAKAREQNRLKDEELRAKGFLREGFIDDTLYNESNDAITSVDSSLSPTTDFLDDTTNTSNITQPKLFVDTTTPKEQKAPVTPVLSTQQGFSSPYLMAAGLISPRSGTSNGTNSPGETPMSNGKINENSNDVDSPASVATLKSVFSNGSGRVVSGKKKKHNSDKMLSYVSDGSGKHSFVLKNKK